MSLSKTMRKPHANHVGDMCKPHKNHVGTCANHVQTIWRSHENHVGAMWKPHEKPCGETCGSMWKTVWKNHVQTIWKPHENHMERQCPGGPKSQDQTRASMWKPHENHGRDMFKPCANHMKNHVGTCANHMPTIWKPHENHVGRQCPGGPKSQTEIWLAYQHMVIKECNLQGRIICYISVFYICMICRFLLKLIYILPVSAWFMYQLTSWDGWMDAMDGMD